MTDTILTGNCIEKLKTLEDNSIDCCITSPPYWGLRSYGTAHVIWDKNNKCEHSWEGHIQKPKVGKGTNANVGANRNSEANMRDCPIITNFCIKCGSWKGELGNEPDFKLFIEHLCQVFDEIKRVLKPNGTCFVNLGDTYGGSGSGTTKNADTSKYIENSKQVYVLPNGTSKASQFRGTSMNKSLCMIPERFAIEMVDRGWCLRNQIIWHKPNQMPSSVTDRFTVDFEKIFFFVKQPTGYYFEQQLEPYTKPLDRWGGDELKTESYPHNPKLEKEMGMQYRLKRDRNMRPNEDGKNMRTVWSINTEPSSEAHFATYPQKLVERMIKAGCPENGIVLDPFFGSGTTGVVAKKLNRHYVGIELNPKYVKIAQARLYRELGMFLNTANTTI